MAQYGKSEYWEDRYQKDKEQFDWYQRYSQLQDIVTQYVNKSDNILNVGCGNSRKSHSPENSLFFHSISSTMKFIEWLVTNAYSCGCRSF